MTTLAFNLDVFLLGLTKEKALDYLKKQDVSFEIIRQDNVFPLKRFEHLKGTVKLEVDSGKISKVHFV